MAKKEKCAICGCTLNDDPKVYATDTEAGRGHRSKSHYIAERLLGRCRTQGDGIFTGRERWLQGSGGKTEDLCFDCHEELLHNPVLLPDDIKRFRDLVFYYGYGERTKIDGDKKKLAKRIKLLHSVIEEGIKVLLAKSR